MDIDSQFELRQKGAFFCIDGAARKRGVPEACNKKLCFTATDQEQLAEDLFRLSQREDCFFVKFGAHDRAGMYLGRCFLLTEEAVGKMWLEYRDHPSIYCTIQDDDFTLPLRD